MIDFNDYNLESYKNDLDKFGIKRVWNEILKYNIDNPDHPIETIEVSSFGELYEIGLVHINKKEKKELGKYYTPIDVSTLMSSWLLDLDGSNVCDVCCGTGNLILSYLDLVGEKEAINLLENERIFLYDIDELALDICRYSIAIIYGEKYLDKIQYFKSDFLDKKIKLPDDSKVISNPPYFKIKEFSENWELSNVLQDSKELYSSIMRKIIKQSVSSVIITPYSFLGGNKFYSLRQFINDSNGFIISFDNVPGNIFNGIKKGIFNSNSTNSIRASITVTENKEGKKGYRISPLIRFKNIERERLLNKKVLEDTLSTEYQKVSSKNKRYYKCFLSIEKLFKAWKKQSKQKIEDLLSNEITDYFLCVPNSCRYFTVASTNDLKRTGKHILYFKSKEDRDFIYCYINSSFAYWHWRLYDGGITYPLGLLKEMPIFISSMDDKSKKKLIKIAEKMQIDEKKYLVYKKNANEMQENIKFPESDRTKINKIFCSALNFDDFSLLDIIHENHFFTKEEDK